MASVSRRHFTLGLSSLAAGSFLKATLQGVPSPHFRLNWDPGNAYFAAGMKAQPAQAGQA